MMLGGAKGKQGILPQIDFSFGASSSFQGIANTAGRLHLWELSSGGWELTANTSFSFYYIVVKCDRGTKSFFYR
jgi:hypothetical protein